MPRLSSELGITSIIFDYTGHGDSPFDIEELSPAQHFLEVVKVFDWIKQNYPNRKVFVIGSSYGGYLATQLTKYREFDALVVLLVVHENDEQSPRETTDAYEKAFKPEVIFVKGVTHSLDNVTQEQVDDYNQRIFDWLHKNVQEK